jgi:DNA-directed RNA polymerase specialized sigma24 family protein
MPSQDVARLRVELSGGNRAVVDALVPIVYSELKRIARGQLRRESPGHTLQATALVNEAYLRLMEHSIASSLNRFTVQPAGRSNAKRPRGST